MENWREVAQRVRNWESGAIPTRSEPSTILRPRRSSRPVVWSSAAEVSRLCPPFEADGPWTFPSSDATPFG